MGPSGSAEWETRCGQGFAEGRALQRQPYRIEIEHLSVADARKARSTAPAQPCRRRRRSFRRLLAPLYSALPRLLPHRQKEQRTYRALVCEKLGHPGEPLGAPHAALKLKQVPAPALTHPNSVRIKVAAAALNFADALQLQVGGCWGCCGRGGRRLRCCRPAGSRTACWAGAPFCPPRPSQPPNRSGPAADNWHTHFTGAGPVPGEAQAALCAGQRVRGHGGRGGARRAHAEGRGQGEGRGWLGGAGRRGAAGPCSASPLLLLPGAWADLYTSTALSPTRPCCRRSRGLPPAASSPPSTAHPSSIGPLCLCRCAR